MPATRLFRRTLPLIAVALLNGLVGSTARAHEVVVKPVLRADGTRSVTPAVIGGTHLEPTPTVLDFGEVLVGTAATRTVSLTNTSARQVTFTALATGPFTLSPAGPFALAPGQSTQIVVTLQSASSLTLNHELAFEVAHEGTSWAFHESVPLAGKVGQPPQLTVTAVTEVGFNASTKVIDVGFISADPTTFDNAPRFQVTVKNTGGLTAHNVSVVAPGPGFSNTVRSCNEVEQATICVQSATGTAPSNLGDLGPGSILQTTWSAMGLASGVFDQGPFLLQADNAAAVNLRVAGEVVPFGLPDDLDFLTSEKFAGLTEKLASSTDPNGDDPLGELRVTGFDARTVFSLGEFDSVDLRTGNLTVVVPIGGEQQVRGPLSYALNAVYNSTLWYRKTLAEFVLEGEKGLVKPIQGLLRDPSFNLIGGWSFHLGRLMPPHTVAGGDPAICEPSDPFFFEYEVDTGEQYVYFDPSGARHELWRRLHDDDTNDGTSYEAQIVSYTRDGSLLRMTKESQNVRWIEEPNGIRRRFQRRNTGSPVLTTPTLPDEWLLTRIEDPYGNRVDVVYNEPTAQGQPTWQIRDAEGANGTPWRQVTVTFTNWQGRHPTQPLLVDKVIFPGFQGGADRVYDFQYVGEGAGILPASLSLAREHRSQYHALARIFCEAQYSKSPDTTAKVPRLAKIVQPDGTAWAFSYDTTFTTVNDDLRLDSLTLPTGGKIGYEYAFARDSSVSCGGSPPPRDRLGVSRRTVVDANPATVLEDVRYLRRLTRTGDVPGNICEAHPGLHGFSLAVPYSQQEVGVWKQFERSTDDLISPATEHTSLTVHHFNVWPLDDTCLPDSTCPGCCNAAGRLKSGRTYIERNTMTDPAQTDGGLLLSTETYDCQRSLAAHPGTGTGVDFQGDRIDLLVADPTCTKRRTTWAEYEVSRAGRCADEFDMSCLLDSRRKSDRTVYHDDGAASVRTDRSDYDGLGHYRREVTTTSAWGPVSVPQRTTFKNFNPTVGTLTLDADHRVSTNITVPATWILDTYSFQWVNEGSTYRGGEACFDPTLGHLEYARTWTCKESTYTCAGAANGDGTLDDVRSTSDLIVRHLVNSDGELIRERHYGADTFPATESIPTGSNWCSDSLWGGTGLGEAKWAGSHQDYSVQFRYAYGFLEDKFVDGDLTNEIDRVADQQTGWTKSETLDSGEVLTYLYDPLGRIEWITSALAASKRFEYTRPAGTAGWRVTETVYPKGVDPAAPTGEIRSTKLSYDGLGRPVGETFPTYNGGEVTRTSTYHPSGQLASVSSLDNGALRRLEYDWAGRPIRLHEFDTSKSAGQYAGIRRSDSITCVDTGPSASGTGICTNTGFAKAEAKMDRDPFDRLLRTESAKGIVTTFTYDPGGRQTSAVRKDAMGGVSVTQRRTWTYDGRGFLRVENIPERDVRTLFSNLNTRGQPRTIEERDKGTGTLKRVSELSYDLGGRLLSLSVGGEPNPASSVQPVKTFTYLTTGSGKGQMDVATRYNYREGETGGVPDTVNGGWQDGAWEVKSDFGYDAAGRRNDRVTQVRWDPQGNGTADAGNWTEFHQGWGYDDLGNITSISYPETLSCSPCPAARTVVPKYSQGFFLTGVDDDITAATSTLGASSITYHKSGLVNQVVHDQGGSDIYGISGGMPRVASINLASGTVAPRNLGSVSYDWAGNIGQIGSDVFDYDLDSRLVTAAVSGTSFQYGYDDFDNFLSTVGKGTINRANNRLQGGVVYDVFGSMTSAGSGQFQLVYDELDKLVQLTLPGGKKRRSIYDHDDLRVVTEVDDGGVTTHWTLRDGGQVLRDFVGRHPKLALEREYVYAGDRLLASKSFGVVETHHPDQVGSPRLLTFSNGGRKLVDYGPFDESLTDSGIPAGGFQGHEDDDGFTTYMRGRQFYRGGGRFLQVDPGRDAAAWSQYGFAANNPLSHVDPNGRDVREIVRVAMNTFTSAEVVIGRLRDTVPYAAATGAYALNMLRYSTLGQAVFETSLWANVATGGTATELAGGGSITGLEAATVSRALWLRYASVPTAVLAMALYGPDLGADVEHDMTPYDGSTMPGAVPSAPLNPQGTSPSAQSTVDSSAGGAQGTGAGTQSTLQGRAQSPQATQLHDLLRSSDSATKREALRRIDELRKQRDQE